MASEAAYPKRKTLLAAVVCLGLASVAAVLVLLEVVPLIAAIDRNRPVITMWGTVLGGAPLTVMFVAVAAMLLLSLQRAPSRP